MRGDTVSDCGEKRLFAIVDTHRNCMLELLKEIMLEDMAAM